MDTIASNQQFMRRFVEFINTADSTRAGDLVSPNAIFHVPGRPDPTLGHLSVFLESAVYGRVAQPKTKIVMRIVIRPLRVRDHLRARPRTRTARNPTSITPAVSLTTVDSHAHIGHGYTHIGHR